MPFKVKHQISVLILSIGKEARMCRKRVIPIRRGYIAKVLLLEQNYSSLKRKSLAKAFRHP